MNKKLLLSSNCQTEGIAEALAAMLPDYQVEQLPIPDGRTDWQYLSTALKDTDILVTSDSFCRQETFLQKYQSIKITHIPQIYFPAFHPDIVYVSNPAGKFVRCLDSDYHSAICLWSWKNNLSTSDCVSLFSQEAFKQLGYLNSWNESLEELKSRFRGTGLDFSHFWGAIKRKIPFMHSINHPHMFVLSELSKQIAVKLGAPDSLYDESIHELLTDRLDAIRWPVYPEIAKLYDIPGMYKWKIRKLKYNSLEEYITKAFASYDSLGYKSEELTFYTDGYGAFDLIMKKLAGGLK